MTDRKPAAQRQACPATATPQPRDEMREYTGRDLLSGKAALVAGGDSGIGRAVAVALAKEGADVAVAYLDEHDDASRTRDLVAATGRQCVLVPGDLTDQAHCRTVAAEAAVAFGRIDVLVNTIAPAPAGEEQPDAGWERTFDVTVDSLFRLTRAALPHMPEGSAIVTTSSVDGGRGDSAPTGDPATKGAIIAWTYRLAQSLRERGIRVNCVAPGPVCTPVTPAPEPGGRVAGGSGQASVGRAAHPDEIAPSYVFFAADQVSSCYTGEVLAPVGGGPLHG